MTAGSISRILFEVWDPFDVNTNESLADEYDDYAKLILPLMENGADERAVELALKEVEDEFEELRFDPTRRREAVFAILKLRARRL